MLFDYKKENKVFYMSKCKLEIINVRKMFFYGSKKNWQSKRRKQIIQK